MIDADLTIDLHRPRAIQYANTHADHYECGLCGECHAVLVVDPAASLYRPLCAVLNVRADDEPIIMIHRTDFIEALLALHDLDTGPLDEAIARVEPDQTLLVGVADGRIVARAVARAAPTLWQ